MPLADVQLLTFVDDNALTVTAQPVHVPAGELILVTLTVGPGPDRAAVKKLLPG